MFQMFHRNTHGKHFKHCYINNDEFSNTKNCHIDAVKSTGNSGVHLLSDKSHRSTEIERFEKTISTFEIDITGMTAKTLKFRASLTNDKVCNI